MICVHCGCDGHVRVVDEHFFWCMKCDKYLPVAK